MLGNPSTYVRKVTAMRCLNSESSPCEGTVELRPAHPERYTITGGYVTFPRCEKHYDAYFEAADLRQERQWANERAERDEWLNFE